MARAYGLLRVFADSHPDLDAWVRDVVRADNPAPSAQPRVSRDTPEPATPHSTPSMALTPKEREVVALLARNLTNKEIGLAMQVGEETIKWHVKNLLIKLDAGTRKHAVQRARLLGLLDTEA